MRSAGVVCAACWAILALEAQGLSPFPLCLRSGDFAAALAAAVSPGALAHGALMLGAMMGPLALAPLQHLRARSFAERRLRASALFFLGYVGVWIVAGLGVFLLAEALRATLGVIDARIAAVALAALWQASPAKQWMLNRCHRRPALAAFGGSGDRDAIRFGVQQGLACAGACWALMASVLLLDRGALAAMALVSVLLLAERCDRPGPLVWGVRPSGKMGRGLWSSWRPIIAMDAE